MREEQSSYRKIMKATSIFGGVQVFKILIAVFRAKIIAVLLGPFGMGISGLLLSTASFIGSVTNFGLGTSAVKNIAEANSTGDLNRVGLVVKVMRRWVWVTGLFGSALAIILSPLLSQITFGNKDYTIAFIWISITLLWNQVSSGQMVLLQGMRKLKYLANANLTGSLLGLVISIPMYYFWGIDGIVPAIIISSFASMLRTWYFARKVKIEPVEITRQITIVEGREMLKMGFILSLSTIISAGDQYLLRIFMSNTGGVEIVGLYNAAFVILNSYIGIVLSSMATDYYPRLSEINTNDGKIRILVTQQASVAILLLIPIIVIFFTFAPIIIKVLYSDKFLSIVPMMRWAILGMFIRAVSWSLGFIPIAKGDSKVVVLSSLVSHIVAFGNNILAFKLLGLLGLGISFTLNNLIYLIGMRVLTGFKYSFKFQTGFYLIFIKGFILCLLAFWVSVSISSMLISYSLGIFILILASIYSFNELNKKLNLKESMLKIQNKFNFSKNL